MNRTKITRQEAITISIELWEELAETGGDQDAKDAWPGWEQYGGRMRNSCALCQYGYAHRRAAESDCSHCPYYLKYGGCQKNDRTVFQRWLLVQTPRTRQKYARLGVEQLKALLED